MLPLIIGLESVSLTPQEESVVQMHQPLGFILFSRNIETAAQVRALTDHLRSLCQHKPIIAIDQEGGRVTRTDALGLALPSAEACGNYADTNLVAQHAKITASTLRMLGINLNFAPVLDIAPPAGVQNALPTRCWGNCATTVLEWAGMYNSNATHAGLLTCGKHFPGLGRAQVDAHLALPTIEADQDSMLATDLVPFVTLMPSLPSMMTSHVMLPAWDTTLPASLSPIITRELLQWQLGFQGLVFTDDLCMQAIADHWGIAEAAALAWQAGCHAPLICHHATQHVAHAAALYAQLDPSLHCELQAACVAFCQAIPAPLVFNQTIWDKLCADATILTAKVGHSQATTPSNALSSPVAQY